MEYIFADVLERDIDLLVLRCFVDNLHFREAILEQLNLAKDCQVLRAGHSIYDADGESDLTFVVQREVSVMNAALEKVLFLQETVLPQLNLDME